MAASVAGIKAGRAFILIEAVDATGKVMDAVGAKFKSWGRSLMMTGMDMAFKAAMGLTGVGATTSIFTKFDDAMRRVEARSEGTGAQLRMLRDEARELGKTTALSAIDVANLAAELAAMGFTRSQMMQMVRPITMLAQAGGTGNKALDAVNAAKLVSGTLRSFQMDFSEAGKVADVMAQALNLSNAALEDMATSMAYAGPIANRYGVSLEDVVSVLGHMRNLNIDAETAGTAFRNMLLEMTDPKGRDKFNKLLDEMTGKTITFVDEAGNLKSVTELLFAIGEVSKGLGTAQQGQLFFELFGKRAIVPASALAEGRNAFEAIRMQMGDVNGVATKMANIMESGLGGSWRRFVGAIIDASIAIGESLAPILQDLSLKFRSVLGSVTEFVTSNRGLIYSIVASVALWGALGLSLIAAGLALRIVAFSLGAIAPVLSVISISFTVLVRTIGLLAATTRLLIAGFGLLMTGARLLAGSTVILNAVLIAVRNSVLLANVASVVLNTTMALSRVVTRFLVAEYIAWRTAMMMTVAAFRILNILMQVGTTGMIVTTAAANGMIVANQALSTSVRGVGTMMLWTQGVSRVFSAGIVTATNLYMSMWTVVRNFFVGMLIPALSTVGTSLLTLLLNPLTLVVAAFAALVYFNRQRIFDAFTSGASQAKSAFTELGQELTNWLNKMKTSAIDLGGTIMSTFTGMSEALAMGDTAAAWEITLNGMQTAWLQLKDMLFKTWGDFVRFFQEAWSGAVGFYSYQAERIRTLGMDEFGQGAVYDEQGNKIQEARRMNREQYLAQFRAKAEERAAKEISDIRAKFDDDDEQRAIEIGEAKVRLEEKLAEIRAKAAIAADEFLQREIEDAKTEMAALALATVGSGGKTPEGIIGVGAGASGLAPEISEGLAKGSVEAAKQAWESTVKAQSLDDKTIAEKTLEHVKGSAETLGRIDKHIELIDATFTNLNTA